MSLFKNKLIGLSLSAFLLGQVTVQAADNKVVLRPTIHGRGLALLVAPAEEKTLARQVKHGARVAGHYAQNACACAGAALGLYLIWNKVNDEIFLRTPEVLNVAFLGGVAGLGLGYVTRHQVNTLEQAALDKRRLAVAHDELASVKPALGRARTERDHALTRQAEIHAALQENAELARKQVASLEQARQEAQQHAQQIQSELDAIKAAGNRLDAHTLAGLMVALTSLQAQYDTLATLTDGLPQSASRKATNQVTLDKMALTLAAAQELQNRGIIPTFDPTTLRTLTAQ